MTTYDVAKLFHIREGTHPHIKHLAITADAASGNRFRISFYPHQRQISSESDVLEQFATIDDDGIKHTGQVNTVTAGIDASQGYWYSGVDIEVFGAMSFARSGAIAYNVTFTYDIVPGDMWYDIETDTPDITKLGSPEVSAGGKFFQTGSTPGEEYYKVDID